MADLSANFWHRERQCSCNACKASSKPYEVDQPALIQRLEEVRRLADIPLVINSWCRCEAHNAQVGGVDSSAHTAGWAIDIRCWAPRNKYIILEAAIRSGFNRIGIAKTFLHFDMDPTKPAKVIWIYS